MSRNVPAPLLAAWSGETAQPYFAIEFLLDSGANRFWTGYGERTVKGDTYIGSGQLISIEGLEEVADLSARGITLTADGLPGEIISMALQEPYQRRVCRVYYGDQSVPDVVMVFSGLINKMTINDSSDTGTISVLVDSKMVEAQKSSNRRYTSESQKSRYAGDTFFNYVTAIQDAEVLWGRNAS